jgi:hypothetical protein
MCAQPNAIWLGLAQCHILKACGYPLMSANSFGEQHLESKSQPPPSKARRTALETPHNLNNHPQPMVTRVTPISAYGTGHIRCVSSSLTGQQQTGSRSLAAESKAALHAPSLETLDSHTSVVDQETPPTDGINVEQLHPGSPSPSSCQEGTCQLCCCSLSLTPNLARLCSSQTPPISSSSGVHDGLIDQNPKHDFTTPPPPRGAPPAAATYRCNSRQNISKAPVGSRQTSFIHPGWHVLHSPAQTTNAMSLDITTTFCEGHPRVSTNQHTNLQCITSVSNRLRRSTTTIPGSDVDRWKH